MRRMNLRAPDDATARHLQLVAEDILGLLGAGIELHEIVVDRETPDITVLRARYQLGGVTGHSVGRGENLIAAHASLRAAIVTDRIGLGFRSLV